MALYSRPDVSVQFVVSQLNNLTLLACTCSQNAKQSTSVCHVIIRVCVENTWSVTGTRNVSESETIFYHIEIGKLSNFWLLWEIGMHVAIGTVYLQSMAVYIYRPTFKFASLLCAICRECLCHPRCRLTSSPIQLKYRMRVGASTCHAYKRPRL
jgi:hypothetical protein